MTKRKREREREREREIVGNKKRSRMMGIQRKNCFCS